MPIWNSDYDCKKEQEDEKVGVGISKMQVKRLTVFILLPFVELLGINGVLPLTVRDIDENISNITSRYLYIDINCSQN